MKLIRFEDKTKIKLFRGNDLGHYDRFPRFYVQRTPRNTDASTANADIVKLNDHCGDG
jgi:hypothetical protein